MTRLPAAPVFGPIDPRASSAPEVDVNALITQIETMGARLAWSRAADCPCGPNNPSSPETIAPDPQCTLCGGLGHYYFGPASYVLPPSPAIGPPLDDVQKRILAQQDSVIIMGLVQKVVNDTDLYDVLGRWVSGAQKVTVRPENRLGFYDRIVNLDAEQTYSEVIAWDPAAPPASGSIRLRYLATRVNVIRSLTTRYDEGTAFDLTTGARAGEIAWRGSGPPKGRLSVHYHMLSPMLVINYPHATRETSVRFRREFQTPAPLPIHAICKLDFIPGPDKTT